MANRDEKGRIVKGSPALNAGGRPKQTPEQKAASEALAGPLTQKAINVLSAQLDGDGPEALKAALAVVERSLGKVAMAPEDLSALAAARPYEGCTKAELLAALRDEK